MCVLPAQGKSARQGKLLKKTRSASEGSLTPHNTDAPEPGLGPRLAPEPGLGPRLAPEPAPGPGLGPELAPELELAPGLGLEAAVGVVPEVAVVLFC